MNSVLLRLVLGIILFCTNCVASDAPQTVQTAEKPAPLRVMSFNIRNSAAKDGENRWSKRKDLVISTIRTFDPDLLGFQEVLADQYDELVSTLSDYTPVGVARDDGKRLGEWAAIFYRKSRFNQSSSGNFWLSENPEQVASFGWDAACVRICTWAKLRDQITGREILYANTHFDHHGETARVNSARLLRTHLPQLATGVPIILSGDFNCTEESAAYRILTGSSETANPEAPLLFDSYRAVHPTQTQTEASFHGFKGTTSGLRIDWILHSKELKSVSAEILQKSDDGRLASDHYPVTAIIE